MDVRLISLRVGSRDDNEPVGNFVYALYGFIPRAFNVSLKANELLISGLT